MLLIGALSALCACHTTEGDKAPEAVIVNGVPWYDDEGHIINSHGSCIVEDGGRYWLFGEYKSDTTNAFPGFGCYSSQDLAHWHFERVVLPVQPDGLMGPQRVGERVKVMRCPKTGRYVMLMHSDDMGYCDPHTAVAVADSINGDYTFVGPLTYHGEPIRKWDIGTFQDQDGTGYLLAHHGPIYRLADDYMTADTMYVDTALVHSGESPAMFRRGDTYYLMYSNLTSWERNDNFYFTAPSVAGPWTRQGLFCPEGTLTWNSQCTYVLPIIHPKDTTWMYMGDRWSYPHQASCATQVWLPLSIEGEKVTISEYWPAWNPMRCQRVALEEDLEPLDAHWASDGIGETFTLPFEGTQAMIVGHTDVHGGYAKVSVTGPDGDILVQTLVDCYSLVPADGVRYVTPLLPRDKYLLTIEVNGDQPVWYNKAGHRYGSDGYWVRTDKVWVRK